MISTLGKYSKENCEVECWAELHIKYCNCTNTIAPINEPYEICPIDKYFKCIHKLRCVLFYCDYNLPETSQRQVFLEKTHP